MDILDEEIVGIWQGLNKFNVRYIVVGGFATNLHGFSRTTADMDIWIENSLPNRKNFRKTLDELGLGDFEEIETTQFVPGRSSIRPKDLLDIEELKKLK